MGMLKLCSNTSSPSQLAGRGQQNGQRLHRMGRSLQPATVRQHSSNCCRRCFSCSGIVGHRCLFHRSKQKQKGAECYCNNRGRKGAVKVKVSNQGSLHPSSLPFKTKIRFV